MEVAQTQLGEVVDLLSGFAFKSSKFGDTGDLPLIRIRDVAKGFSSTFYTGDYDTRFVIDSGDMLISMDGEFKVHNWTGGKALLNQRVCKISTNEQRMDSRYLRHFLPLALKKIEDQTPFVTVKHLSANSIKSITLNLPPIKEQRRIASILDKAASICRQQQQAMTLADDFLRVTFLDMFGDPAVNPKDHPTEKLGDLLEFLTSGSRGWAKYYSEEGDNFIRIGNVGRDQLIRNDMQKIVPPDNAEARRTKVKAGDVLLSITADLGRTCVVPPNLGPTYVNQHLAILRPQSINSQFLSAFLTSKGGQHQFESLDRGGVKSGLNFDDIRSLAIPVPPTKLQKQYVQLASKIEIFQDNLDKNLSRSMLLFKSVSQRAFSGEL